MARKPCIEPGCPVLTDRTRCPDHTRQRDQARGTRQERGYDAAHDRTRREYVTRLNCGEVLTCWRCLGNIHTAAELHVGHDDLDRSLPLRPEHALCNLSAAGRISRMR